MTEDILVVTYNGASEKKKDCVFIRGKYYHKKKDCFLYEGMYYSPFSRYLVLDHETKERVHVSSKELLFGVIGNTDNKFTLGHFSKNIAKNGMIFLPSSLEDEEIKSIIDDTRNACLGKSPMNESEPESGWISMERGSLEPRPQSRKKPITSERLVRCMNIGEFEGDWIKSKNSDSICLKKDVPLYDKCTSPKLLEISAINQYDFNLAYNSEVMMDVFQKSFYDNKFKPNAKALNLVKYIGAKTFGIEYESWDGRIPTPDCAKAGLIPVRDGSLRHDGVCGFEYATVIMSGVDGLMAIKDQCKLLKHNTIFNERCSMHIHVGTIPRTEENLVRLYKAFYTAQDSLYSLFPSCLQHTASYKQKDYCSRLPELNENAHEIVKWLSDGKEIFKAFGRPHPKDTSAQSKWNILSRYAQTNLNNFYYTNRGTVELRVSTPTYNHNKVSALLIIMSLIIDSAVNDGQYWTDIVGLVAAKMTRPEKTWMLNYITCRQEVLNKWIPNGGDIKYYENIKNDGETGNNEEELY
jgi:hypothetical protein